MAILGIATGVLLTVAIVQIASQSAAIGELERYQMRLERRLEEADDELQMLRCEYERSLGGTDYQWRPVNRISRMYPR